MGETYYKFVDSDFSPTTTKKIESLLVNPELTIEDDEVIDVNAVLSDDEDTWLYTSKPVTNQHIREFDNNSKIKTGTYPRRKKNYLLKTDDCRIPLKEEEDEIRISPVNYANGSDDTSTISSTSFVNLNATNSLSFLDHEVSVDSVRKFLERTPKISTIDNKNECPATGDRFARLIGQSLMTEDDLKRHQIMIEERNETRDLLAEKYEQPTSDNKKHILSKNNGDNLTPSRGGSDGGVLSANLAPPHIKKRLTFENINEKKSSIRETIITLEKKLGFSYDNSDAQLTSSNKFNNNNDDNSYNNYKKTDNNLCVTNFVNKNLPNNIKNFVNDTNNNSVQYRRNFDINDEFQKSNNQNINQRNIDNRKDTIDKNSRYTKQRSNKTYEELEEDEADGEEDNKGRTIITVIPCTSTPSVVDIKKRSILHNNNNNRISIKSFEDSSSSDDDEESTTDLFSKGSSSNDDMLSSTKATIASNNNNNNPNLMNVSYIKLSPKNHISKLPKCADDNKCRLNEAGFNDTVLCRRKSDYEDIMKFKNDQRRHHRANEDDRGSSTSDSNSSLSSASYSGTAPSMADVQILAQLQEMNLKEEINAMNRSTEKQDYCKTGGICDSNEDGKRYLDVISPLKKQTITGFSNSTGRIYTTKSGGTTFKYANTTITKASSSETVTRSSRSNVFFKNNGLTSTENKPPQRAQSTNRSFGSSNSHSSTKSAPTRISPVILPPSEKVIPVFKQPLPPSSVSTTFISSATNQKHGVVSHIPRLSGTTRIPLRSASGRSSAIPTAQRK